MLAIDTETTGLDMYKGARPFFVTTCTEEGIQRWFEWDIDPLTRMPVVPKEDIREIRRILLHTVNKDNLLIGQNIKFDAAALASIEIRQWPWSSTRDTLLAAHLLTSNQSKDLTTLAIRYLGIDIEPHEKALHEAVRKCRSLVQQARLKKKRGKETSSLADWRIAEEGEEDMPSAKGKSVGKADYWLPRAMVKHLWSTSEAGQSYAARLLDPKTKRALAVRYSLHSETPDGIIYDRAIEEREPDPAVWKAQQLEGWEYHPPEVSSEGAHLWWNVLSTYANADSAVTLALWPVMWEEICRRKYDKIYLEQMRLPEIAYDMERRGVTGSISRASALETQYTIETEEAECRCINIASSYEVEIDGQLQPYPLVIPKGSRSNSLNEFVFNVLKLPVIQYTEKGNPAFNKACLEEYLTSLPSHSKALSFIQNLQAKRQRDTAIGFLRSYNSFWIPLAGEFGDYFRLHPSLNITGTDTLRMSQSNPNTQQVSKKGIDVRCESCEGEGWVNRESGERNRQAQVMEECKACAGSGRQSINLRRVFGPAPGREWWPMDYENIELRIPAYAANERAMIELFEKPNDPPYYGSNHLLNCHTVYRDVWEKLEKQVGFEQVGPEFKKRYKSTYYQDGKNGGFCKQYGGQRVKTDATFRRVGAFDALETRFHGLRGLNQQLIKFADKHGYIETMPDRTVDPERGYPLLCTRTEYGRILPTVPLSYYVQGTAMQCTRKAMIRCFEQLREWREVEGFDGYLTLQVHDELVPDFPYVPKRGNLTKALRLKELMEQSGEDIGVPLRVAVSYCPESWDRGEEI